MVVFKLVNVKRNKKYHRFWTFSDNYKNDKQLISIITKTFFKKSDCIKQILQKLKYRV